MRIVFFMMGLLFSLILFSCKKASRKKEGYTPLPEREKTKMDPSAEGLSSVMDFSAFPFEDSKKGRLAEYGKKLMAETYNYFYRDGEKIGNHLACDNCHLNNGTKPYSAPYVGVSAVFPQYRGREDKMGTLEDRINGCFERSMNGEPLPQDSKEMRAMVAYIDHLSQNVKKGKRLPGQGFVDLEIPDRAADPQKGKTVYTQECVMCHRPDGAGIKDPDENGGYLYPPLWGPDSFNDGAGMARVLTAARFIKGNMPYGTTFDKPRLSDQEAYDVAAYINSFDRPEKADKEKDYPDLSKKPKDAPYGPYPDTLSQNHHKYGPFDF